MKETTNEFDMRFLDTKSFVGVPEYLIGVKVFQKICFRMVESPRA